MTTVAVLGASGMLGAMTTDVLAAEKDLRVIGTVRNSQARDRFAEMYPDVEWRLLDAELAGESAVAAAISGAAWAVNCIGIIKPYIHDDNADETERALKVNSLFPQFLAKAAQKSGTRVLQIATDCVYSGSQGAYPESAPHDALDVYGKTKSLGEPYVGGTHLMRCSIIGPEPKAFVSLLEWFLGRPRGAQVNGFTNHRWNGVTTYHFAKLCKAIIGGGLQLPRAQHVVASGSLSKSEMLSCFARVYGREDVVITPVEAKVVIDRTLSTENPTLNAQLWKAAGYPEPPTVPQMIEEMGSVSCRWREKRR